MIVIFDNKIIDNEIALPVSQNNHIKTKIKQKKNKKNIKNDEKKKIGKLRFCHNISVCFFFQLKRIFFSQ